MTNLMHKLSKKDRRKIIFFIKKEYLNSKNYLFLYSDNKNFIVNAN